MPSLPSLPPVITKDGVWERPARKWSPNVRAWWRDAWTSPMAHMWHERGDKPSMDRLCIAWQDTQDYVPGSHGVVQALEDRLGFSPLSRRKLEWNIVRDAGPEAAKDAQGNLPVDDMRRRLKAVK
jgi:hypothetical protein